MKKRQKSKKVTARDWGVVALINRAGGKGRHRSKKHRPRCTEKVAFRKSLMRNDSHEAFFMFSSGDIIMNKSNSCRIDTSPRQWATPSRFRNIFP